MKLFLMAVMCGFLAFAAGLAPATVAGTASLEDQVQSGRLSDEILEQMAATGRAEVLVSFDAEDIRDAAASWRADQGLARDSAEILKEKAAQYAQLKQWLLAWLSSGDYEVLQDYDHFAVLYLRVNRQALDTLLGLGEGVRVSENGVLHPCLSQSLPLIDADLAHAAGATGQGTSVAVLDTGVDYTHPAFGDCSGGPGTPGCKVAFAQDFTEEDDGSLDDNGHGTNVAGIVLGVAPDTSILALDVFEGSGAYYSDLLAALDWVMDHRDVYNIAAVNMSLGDGVRYTAPCSTDHLAGAVSDLRDAGIASAIAAGNEGYKNGISAPGCVPDAVSVGAVYDSNMGPIWWSSCLDVTTQADKITCFSNFASFMTMLAPGAMISAAGLSYGGTSQAAPHVAGAIAVLMGVEEGIPVDDAVQVLVSTGVPIADTRTRGGGVEKPRLDLYEAVLQLPPAYMLTVVKTGTGTGSVFSQNALHGIDCGPDCSEIYDDVTLVTLAAVPDEGSRFTGWSVPSCGGDPECEITVDGNRTVTAAFDLLPPEADFYADVLEGPAPLIVHFTDDSTQSPVAWEWDFIGGGAPMSTEQNPTHVYKTAGYYTVSLTAYYAGGSDTETKTDYITVTDTCASGPVQTGGLDYATLQAGYGAAADGAVIYAHAVDFAEDLDLDAAKTVTFDWGWDCDFNESIGEGGFNGTLTIRRGTLIVARKTVIGM